ncbi:MAG: ABC transporter ATP-binding protein YtrB [Firmicutes bacterium ADurb.Bin419]|nr:MAG: ABC transporter ATP-binding protein YtrB [Firmicutes bacterium ADurb.Bin419]
MIEICGVHKEIDENQILKDINLSIKEGSILGLIGPNGAGKTTLIKILTGVWQADNGKVTFNNSPVFDNKEIKRKIGYVPDFCHYYENFKVRDLIKFYKLAYDKFDEKRFDELNNGFEISKAKRVNCLSKGTKAKLMLALSLSINPEYLILDEPTSGLDPIAKRKFVELILEEVAERKTTVLISTHNLADVEQICDSIAIINSGEIKYNGTIDDIKQKVTKLQVVFPNGFSKDAFGEEIVDLKNVGSIYYIITKKYSKEFEEKLKACGATLVEEVDLSLEEIFVYSYGKGE